MLLINYDAYCVHCINGKCLQLMGRTFSCGIYRIYDRRDSNYNFTCAIDF